MIFLFFFLLQVERVASEVLTQFTQTVNWVQSDPPRRSHRTKDPVIKTKQNTERTIDR